MTESHSPSQATALAVQAGLDRYLKARRERIPLLLEKFLSLKDCAEIQGRHLVKDVVKNPLNTFWAIPSMAVRKVLEILEKLGLDLAKSILPNIPRNFKTGYHLEVEKLILSVLFGVPADRTQPSELAQLLEQSAQNEPALRDYLHSTDWKLLAADTDREIRAAVSDYCSTQNSFTDLAASGGILLAAQRFFGDGSLDAFGIGRHWANLWAREDAQNHFFLGKKIGKAFYKVVPPPPPTHLQIYATTAIVLVSVAVFCTAINVLSLPAQSKLGFQKKQLEKLIASLEDKLLLRFTKALRK